MQSARGPGLLSILLLALGLALVVLTSIDEFQQLADGIYGVQAIASALAVILFGVTLLVLFVRRVKRNIRYPPMESGARYGVSSPRKPGRRI